LSERELTVVGICASDGGVASGREPAGAGLGSPVECRGS